jgi:D-alanyl-lipoteichoic acid acyltransferase DltB (MBOAT superfamily)
MALIVIRYVPGEAYVALGHILGKTWRGVPMMIGISYLAFRCSRLVLEIRNGTVKKPNFLEYVNFAFFLPTMPVGPINNYANFRRGFTPSPAGVGEGARRADEGSQGKTIPYDVPVGRAALRILVGAVKFQFLGNLCNRLTYSGLLLDDHPHHWMDLPVAMLFFYLYLYLNFSGFCDMAIGAAAIIGIPVPENFDNPFAARNVKDFWNRWHITLSTWMRDVVFSPLSKFFVGQFGIKLADHAIALAIVIVFLLVGIWHGAGWNFVAYGAAHALGVVSNHYYTIFLKKKLGRERFKAYNENPWIRAVAVGLTFCYCGASLIFFANTFPQIKQIFSVLQ